MYSRQRNRLWAPSKSGHKKLAIVVVLAGLFLALVIPVAIDLLDPRIHVVNDLHNILGFAPAGWIPEMRSGTELMVRDCRMRLASALLKEHRTRGSNTFLFTAVKPGSGTTSVALDIASEMHRLGTEALVVEANAFHPDERFGTSPGLNEALAGRIDPEAAIRNSDLMPPRLPVGDPGKERQLVSISRIGATLRELRRLYPIILIDAPPILLSGDTEYLAGVADVTLLIADAQGVTKAEVTRAARILERLKPSAVGAILNRVQVFRVGGYYREILQEYKTAARTQPSLLASPWLWK